ncbi:TPA: phage tail protein, partial [Pasteurella multocida]|nr:phage tail protein [Pasteurella multocida]HEH9825314.1 phage tail protein [Pasteurella multocida]
MAKEFASLGIIEVDGLEIDLTKCDVRVITGRKPVKTINRKARV